MALALWDLFEMAAFFEGAEIKLFTTSKIRWGVKSVGNIFKTQRIRFPNGYFSFSN